MIQGRTPTQSEFGLGSCSRSCSLDRSSWKRQVHLEARSFTVGLDFLLLEMSVKFERLQLISLTTTICRRQV